MSFNKFLLGKETLDPTKVQAFIGVPLNKFLTCNNLQISNVALLVALLSTAK